MSGKLATYREGDSAEYLSLFFLSKIGLVTPIPRQEDIGIDFFCQLGDNESGVLKFGERFLLQTKSNHKPIVYGKPKAAKWKAQDIEWLFKLELPFFIGICNQKSKEFKIYNTTGLHFLYWQKYKLNQTPTLIEFRGNKIDEELLIGGPEEFPINDWSPVDKGDGFKYKINMGNPILTFTLSDLEDKKILSVKKDVLRKLIITEQQNILFKKLNIYHFMWVRKNANNEIELLAWMHYGIHTDNDPLVLENFFKSISPSIVALAMCLKQNNETSLLKSLKPLFDRLPEETKYSELQQFLPELF